MRKHEAILAQRKIINYLNESMSNQKGDQSIALVVALDQMQNLCDVLINDKWW